MLISKETGHSADTRWRYLAILGIVLMTKIALADIYFWEDSDGVIHFSNREAPPQSELYAREHIDHTLTPVESENVDPQQARLEQARIRQKELQEKLAASLAKVDQLAQKVEAAQEVAHEATLEAARALAKADQSSSAPDYSQSPVRERIVYYAAPRVHKNLKHKKSRRSYLKQKVGRYSAVHRDAKKKQYQDPGRFSSVHRKATVRQSQKHLSQRKHHLRGRGIHGRDDRQRRPSTYRGVRSVGK